jgi:hypothetical protein
VDTKKASKSTPLGVDPTQQADAAEPPASRYVPAITSKQAAEDRFTIAQVIHALEASAGLVLGAAQRLRCHRDTIQYYLSRYPEVAAARRSIRADLVDLAESQLIHLIRERHPATLAFFLRTQARDRGYSDRREISPLPADPQPRPVAVDWGKIPEQVRRDLEAGLRASGQWPAPASGVDWSKLPTDTLVELRDALAASGQGLRENAPERYH